MEKDIVSFFIAISATAYRLLLLTRHPGIATPYAARTTKTKTGKEPLPRSWIWVPENLSYTQSPALFQQWMDTAFFNTSHIKLSSRKDSLIGNTRWKENGRVGILELNTRLLDSTTYRFSIDTLSFRNINGMYTDSASFDFAAPEANRTSGN